MSIIPWSSGRLLVWDTTCCDMLAPSNLLASVTEAGAAAAQTERKKTTKYSHLDSSSYQWACGAFGPPAQEFFRELGRRVKRATQMDDSYKHLIERISVAV